MGPQQGRGAGYHASAQCGDADRSPGELGQGQKGHVFPDAQGEREGQKDVDRQGDAEETQFDPLLEGRSALDQHRSEGYNAQDRYGEPQAWGEGWIGRRRVQGGGGRQDLSERDEVEPEVEEALGDALKADPLPLPQGGPPEESGEGEREGQAGHGSQDSSWLSLLP